MKYILTILCLYITTSLLSQESTYQDSLSGFYTYLGVSALVNEELLFIGPTVETAYAINGFFGGLGFTYGEYVTQLKENICLCNTIISGQSPQINFYDFYTVSVLLDDNFGFSWRIKNLIITPRLFTFEGSISYLSPKATINVQTGISYNAFYDDTYFFIRTLYNINTIFKK